MTAILVFLICSLSPAEAVVTPEGVAGITFETTREDLNDLFAPDDLEDTSEHLGEGYYARGTVILPGSPWEIAVVWEDDNPGEIRIKGDSLRTEDGIGLGSTLAELVEISGPVEIAGFAWDMEGFVNLLETPLEGLFIRVTPFGEVPDEFMGDSMFFSEDMMGMDLRVTDFRIFFR